VRNLASKQPFAFLTVYVVTKSQQNNVFIVL